MIKNNKNKMKNNNNKINLNPYYISGLVQSDGNFSVRTNKKDNNIWLSPAFNITLHKKNEELIINIKNYFNVGHYRIDNKGYCRYNVTDLKDLNNIIIPFFLKYQLKSEKFNSFIMFKIICNKLNNKEHLNLIKNKNIKYNKLIKDNNPNVIFTSKFKESLSNIRFNIIKLYLINLAYNINPLSNNRKLKSRENLLKFLNKDERLIVLSKDLNYELLIKQEIIKYKNNDKINIDFIKGLIDGDGSITTYITNELSLRVDFSITQDIHNISLLYEIKEFFNNVGNISDLKCNAFRYDIRSRHDILNEFIPKFNNNYSNGINNNVRLFKIKYMIKLLEFINNNNSSIIKNKEQLIKVSKLMYWIFNNVNNLTLNQYINFMLNKFKNKIN